MSIPLIIGVTGHRDIVEAEIPLLKDRTRAMFAELRAAFPDLPLALMSPLAEGADQLVADVAIEEDIPVYGLLPMPVDLYREDFAGDVLEKFNSLLTQSIVIELPVSGQGELNRDQQYVSLAGYLAGHCHILLALWDGEETHVPGGTSAVIRFHQHDTMSQVNEAQPINPIDFVEDESDLVYHITCSRRSGTAQQDAGSGAWLTRDDVTPRTREMPERYHLVFNRMIEYNQDIASLDPTEDASLLPGSETPARLVDITRNFSIADSLAGYFQSRMYTALRIGYGFALLAGLSFIVYADLVDEPLMMYAYLSSMVLVLLAFRVEASQGWQRKYLDYRVLAEAIRVQFYWQLAGVQMDNPYHYAHDRFHDRRDLQLGWIRHVMRYAAISTDAMVHTANADDVNAVIQNWIRDEQLGQTSYFQSKAQERAGKNRHTETIESLSLFIVLAIAVLLILSQGELVFTDFLIAIVGFIPFGIAVRQNFAHRVAERELIAQYQYFYRIFSSADELLNRTSQLDGQRRILRALGEAALEESSQWILRQRERPISTSGIMG